MKFSLKAVLLLLSFCVFIGPASGQLATSRTIINDDKTAVIHLNFPTAVKGDLYLFTVFNGVYLYFTDHGKSLSTLATPFAKNGTFNGSIKALELASTGIPPNQYPLYLLITKPDTDPFNYTNWVDGFASLHKLKLTFGIPGNLAGDADNDGFADNDPNHDGYPDNLQTIRCELTNTNNGSNLACIPPITSANIALNSLNNSAASKADIYLAAISNGQPAFIINQANKLSIQALPAPFQTNVDSLTKMSEITLSNSDLLPAGEYTGYQIVTYNNTNVLNFNNWLGGLEAVNAFKISIIKPAALSSLANANANNCSNGATECLPQLPASIIPAKVSLNGKDLFNSKCAGCHGTNPAANQNHILDAKDYKEISEAIDKNKGNMIILKGTTENELKAIADYVKSF